MEQPRHVVYVSLVFTLSVTTRSTRNPPVVRDCSAEELLITTAKSNWCLLNCCYSFTSLAIHATEETAIHQLASKEQHRSSCSFTNLTMTLTLVCLNRTNPNTSQMGHISTLLMWYNVHSSSSTSLFSYSSELWYHLVLQNTKWIISIHSKGIIFT